MFVISVGILFNKVSTLSVFLQIYSSKAHKREVTDVNMGCGKTLKKPRLFNKNNLEIFWILFSFFFFYSEDHFRGSNST